MSYMCHARNELVKKEPMILVPIEQREVNYANYSVSLRGNKLIKQFMGMSKGFETVKEVSVSKSMSEAFITNNPPKTVGVKNITVEYKVHYISNEAYNNAIAKNNIVVYDHVREEPKQVQPSFTYRMDDEWSKDNE